MTKLLERPITKIALVLIMALVAVSCGRRGGLEAPLSPTVISVDEQGNEIQKQEAEKVEDKPFILDGLL